ncbi:MAG: hypothetical protein BWX64_01949 [Acidobacteria bacterium ADurb.Bin051]|nr:MAG: hypothetical protein BWX64_01949 [Acidobacteria bacterium ADurb.Bin051]
MGPAVVDRAAIGEQLPRRGLLVVLVGDLADDLLDQVLDRHQPRGAAVLVDHDRHLLPPGLELAQQLAERLGLRHEEGRLGERRRLADRLRRTERREHVADVEDADDPVDRIDEERDAGVRRADEPVGEGLERFAGGSADHVDPRRHHAAHLRVAEVDDPPDQLALLGVEDPLPGPHLEERLDLLLARLLVFRLLPLALLRRRAPEERREQRQEGGEQHAQAPVRPGEAFEELLRPREEDRARRQLGEREQEDDHPRRPEHRPAAAEAAGERGDGEEEPEREELRQQAREEAERLEPRRLAVQQPERAPGPLGPVPEPDRSGALDEGREEEDQRRERQEQQYRPERRDGEPFTHDRATSVEGAVRAGSSRRGRSRDRGRGSAGGRGARAAAARARPGAPPPRPAGAPRAR